jgi:predicted transcriptional regulator
MCKDILISLRPEHSDDILSGRKTVELRRRPVRVDPGTRVWLYTKLPRGSVDAFAIVDAVYEGSQEELWEQFGDKVAISRTDFDEYMDGMCTGCAIVFRSVAPLCRAVQLREIRQRVKTFHPPQFFKKLLPDSKELALLINMQVKES